MITGSGTGSFFAEADEVILVCFTNLCQGTDNFGSVVQKFFGSRFFKAASRLDSSGYEEKIQNTDMTGT